MAEPQEGVAMACFGAGFNVLVSELDRAWSKMAVLCFAQLIQAGRKESILRPELRQKR